MSVNKAEGAEEAEAVPMYSIQADQLNIPIPNIPILKEIEPYHLTGLEPTSINPCSEGLEDPVLVHEESDLNEGVDNDNNNGRMNRAPSDVGPGCCRRYSCCFPLIIITLIWLMMISAEAFEHCQQCQSSIKEYSCAIEGQLTDYYCKTDKIQICCQYYENGCREVDYPQQFDYKMGTTNINPCSEGLEDPVLINNDDCDVNEGIDNNDNNEIRVEGGNKRDAPGCCRRYSCCFPLIIITLVWLMMISAEAFEHCQDCKSSISEYQCFDSEQRADFYCKSDKIQICCYYTSDDCRIIDYPKELDYKMGQYFSLSMSVVIILCLIPCLLPCGVPIMLYNDCKNNKYSIKRQLHFDILCTTCFVFGALGCSWTIFEYYKYPKNRCSSNSELFGISTSDTHNDNGLDKGNIWIMSQTTYCSFFSLILLCSFSVCGVITVILQSIAKRKKNAAIVAKPDNFAGNKD